MYGRGAYQPLGGHSFDLGSLRCAPRVRETPSPVRSIAFCVVDCLLLVDGQPASWPVPNRILWALGAWGEGLWAWGPACSDGYVVPVYMAGVAPHAALPKRGAGFVVGFLMFFASAGVSPSKGTLSWGQETAYGATSSGVGWSRNGMKSRVSGALCRPLLLISDLVDRFI